MSVLNPLKHWMLVAFLVSLLAVSLAIACDTAEPAAAPPADTPAPAAAAAPTTAPAHGHRCPGSGNRRANRYAPTRGSSRRRPRRSQSGSPR